MYIISINKTYTRIEHGYVKETLVGKYSIRKQCKSSRVTDLRPLAQ